MLNITRNCIRSNLNTINRRVLVNNKVLNQLPQSRSFVSYILKDIFNNSTPKIKQGTLFSILACTGLGVTIYSVLEFYTKFTTWPPEIRNDLRLAVKCKNVNDIHKSEEAFRKALEKSQDLPEHQFKPTKLLAITGIQISLASLFEQSDPSLSINELKVAFETLLKHKNTLNSSELHRAIAISQKIGDLSFKSGNLTNAEHYYQWGVESMLKIGLDNTHKSTPNVDKDNYQNQVLVYDLNLPNWVSRSDLGASLERLGALFAQRGEPNNAIPLYVQALSLLMPPKEKREREPNVDERCRAGILMTNLSQILTINPSTKNLKTALTWANKSVDVTEHAINLSSNSSNICDKTLAVGYFNIGVLNEMLKNPNEAVVNLNKCLTKSQQVGLKDGISQSKEALRRINNNNVN